MISSWYVNKQAPSDWRRILWGSVQSLLGVLALIVALVVMGIIIQQYLDVEALRGLIENYGMLAPLIFIALCALKNVLFIPVIPLGFLIGLGSLIFGAAYGSCYFWLGTTMGACMAFGVARYWLKNFAARLKLGKLKRLDDMISGNGFLSMVGLRLVLFSNIPLNLGSGLTSITLRDYVLGTTIGLIPRTFVVAYIFESVQYPNIWGALLTYPGSLFLPLLLLSKVGGGLLLVFLAKSSAKHAAQAGG
jgi:uncharacterized membrane protein YdjX (TVP38/TMEM64 family)